MALCPSPSPHRPCIACHRVRRCALGATEGAPEGPLVGERAERPARVAGHRHAAQPRPVPKQTPHAAGDAVLRRGGAQRHPGGAPAGQAAAPRLRQQPQAQWLPVAALEGARGRAVRRRGSGAPTQMHAHAEYGRAAHWLYKEEDGRREIAESLWGSGELGKAQQRAPGGRPSTEGTPSPCTRALVHVRHGGRARHAREPAGMAPVRRRVACAPTRVARDGCAGRRTRRSSRLASCTRRCAPRASFARPPTASWSRSTNASVEEALRSLERLRRGAGWPGATPPPEGAAAEGLCEREGGQGRLRHAQRRRAEHPESAIWDDGGAGVCARRASRSKQVRMPASRLRLVTGQSACHGRGASYNRTSRVTGRRFKSKRSASSNAGGDRGLDMAVALRPRMDHTRHSASRRVERSRWRPLGHAIWHLWPL